MNAKFNTTFAVGRCFATRDKLKSTFREFDITYNVVFSIKDSLLSMGQFIYNCKHGGFKHERTDDIETIDLTATEK